MKGYQCRVERDSISPQGSRLTTFVIRFPRVVLAETVTHRVNSDAWGDCEISWCERTTDKSISKNSASSRAIPFERMRDGILADPYMPQWTLNQRGMQGAALTNEALIATANLTWTKALEFMAAQAAHLHSIGIHKQDCNRLLEPWAWVTQVVTSSRWDNFFALRCHHAAHPAFRTIARMMFLSRRKSVPTPLRYGQWHLPFVPHADQMAFQWEPVVQYLEPGENFTRFKTKDTLPDPIKFSAARCAWVSYENHDKDGAPEQMLKTFDRLVAEVPVHASPVEHQATPSEPFGHRPSNLTGWIQARKLLPHEEVKEYNPGPDEVASWGLGE